MQYTLRQIPPELDRALRRQARESGRSLNETAIRALADGAGLGLRPVKRRDLSDIAGTWIDDPEFDAAIADQDRVDEEMWR